MAVEPIFKDGDEDDTDVYNDGLIVKILENGYTVTVIDTDAGEESHVFVKGRDDFEMMSFIRDSLGIS